MKCIVNMNGKIVPLNKAKISVLDHGFLYGDSVYETFRTFSGYPFQMGQHIDRLFRSAKAIQLKPPASKKTIKAEILKTTLAYWRRYKKSELYIRVIVSRGYGDIGFDPALCPKSELIIIVKKFTPLSRRAYTKGVHIALVSTLRNNPRAIDPNIKSGNYLNNIIAFQEAKRRNAYDAIMKNQHGYLTEGTTSNLFIVKRGTIFTPSKKSGLLKGLTRRLILDLARHNRIKTKECNMTRNALFSADECFISSSLKGVLPVNKCNSRNIASGKPGPITKELMNLFDNAVKKSIQEEYCIDL